MCAWAEFSHVDTNVPLLRLLQHICGEEDFPKTSAKQRGGVRSGCRTLLSQVCLVEEAGSRDIDRRASSITDWPSQDCAPAVPSTANAGKRSATDFRKTVPHLVYYCPDNRTRSFNTTNTKLPLNPILSQFHLISVIITCSPETRPNFSSPIIHLLLRSSVDHFVILNPVVFQVY